jgi:hypothetical protein
VSENVIRMMTWPQFAAAKKWRDKSNGSISGKFSGNFRDGLDLHVAKKTFAAFGLQADFSRSNRRGRTAVETLRVMQSHDDLAVDDVNAVAVESDQVERVPFALRLLGVNRVRAMIADRTFLKKNRVCAGRIVTPQISVPPRRHGDLRRSEYRSPNSFWQIWNSKERGQVLSARPASLWQK